MDRERLFSEPKVQVCFPVDLDAEVRAKGGGLCDTCDAWKTEMFPLDLGDNGPNETICYDCVDPGNAKQKAILMWRQLNGG